MHKKKIKFGFTLLELLVVIGIIALLVSMTMVSYSTSQKKARDAKRKSDVRAIQSALEQYYSICGYTYKSYAGGFVDSGILCTSINPTVAIMPTVPVDPKTITPYQCNSCDDSKYTVCTNNLEAESPTGFCVLSQQ